MRKVPRVFEFSLIFFGKTTGTSLMGFGKSRKVKGMTGKGGKGKKNIARSQTIDEPTATTTPSRVKAKRRNSIENDEGGKADSEFSRDSTPEIYHSEQAFTIDIAKLEKAKDGSLTRTRLLGASFISLVAGVLLSTLRRSKPWRMRMARIPVTNLMKPTRTRVMVYSQWEVTLLAILYMKLFQTPLGSL